MQHHFKDVGFCNLHQIIRQTVLNKFQIFWEKNSDIFDDHANCLCVDTTSGFLFSDSSQLLAMPVDQSD